MLVRIESIAVPGRDGAADALCTGGGGPAGFYRDLGFVPRGEFDGHGEVQVPWYSSRPPTLVWAYRTLSISVRLHRHGSVSAICLDSACLFAKYVLSEDGQLRGHLLALWYDEKL